MPQAYPNFFSCACGSDHTPYDYQVRLAQSPCEGRLITIPTGLGKTAAVVLAWLYNRVHQQKADWPCRLVYCLPMRTLVEQTRDEANKWIEALHRAGDITVKPRVVILMGGEELKDYERNWDLHPEDNTILIGTQDMLLSRALNRGYGMSRYRWPMHFGLLNNDCLWVMDETQLMGSALWTTAQLDWMRRDRFPSLKPCVSWWMSATSGTTFFGTLDRQQAKMAVPEPLCLSPVEERSIVALKALRPVQSFAFKPLAKKKNQIEAEGSTSKTTFEQLAKAVFDEHQPNHLSLVVCNRVRYAQEILAAIQSLKPATEVVLLTSRFRRKDRQETLRKVLAFEKARKAGQPHAGLILVSTQVIEAGFDISAARLWTEAAPWPSFIQRLGRLNRDAKLNTSSAKAKAFVFQIPPEKKGETGPYDANDLKVGAQIVSKLEALCAKEPQATIRELLAKLVADSDTGKAITKALEPKQEPFPRAYDVLGLFSTEPDVFGGFTDVSPWVRNSDPNADVSVFWRAFKPTDRDANANEGPGLQADELCAVAVNRLREHLGTSRKAWTWEPKKKRWINIRSDDLRPGMTIMLPASHGGYDVAIGWTGETSSKLDEAPPPGAFEEGDEDDQESQIGQWVTLETHLADTRAVAQQIASALHLASSYERCLTESAAFHDIGKSLTQWHDKLPTPHPSSADLYAKAPWELRIDLAKSPDAAAQSCEIILRTPGQTILHSRTEADKQCILLQLRLKPKRIVLDELETILHARPKLTAFRPGCRHEVASALAMWSRYYHGAHPADFPALAIYIVAAHHGKARTALNANPRVPVPNVCGIPTDPSQTLAWNPEWKLDFDAAVDGASGDFNDDDTFSFNAPGWTGLVADLLGGWEKDAATLTCGAVPKSEPHALGPFTLAYFEALLRAADGRSSAAPSREVTHDSQAIQDTTE
jgi:CRISPR-associated endonuclease/helicase Cas3